MDHAAALRAAYDAAPKDCNGRAKMLDLRELAGLTEGEFDRVVIALYREHLIGATFAWAGSTLAEDRASVLIDGESRHLLVWGRWDERPKHNQVMCRGH